MDEKDDPFVEDLLARYRPAAPDDAFRERVLAAASVRPAAAATRPPILELAAALVIAAGLHWTAVNTEKRAADLVDAVRDTAEIEATLISAGLPPEYIAWWLAAPPSAEPRPVEGES